MIKNEIAPGIVVYSNVIDDYKFLVEEIEESVSRKVIRWSEAYVKNSEESRVDKNTRDTLTIGIPYDPRKSEDFSSPATSFFTSLSSLFFESFDPIERDYFSHFGISSVSHDSYSILKYGVGQKFVNHIDDHPDYHRRVSTVYYMNDNYEGGEINFPRFGICYKPMANEMLVFPSTYVYNHSVNEVTSGTRYAVVSWMK